MGEWQLTTTKLTYPSMRSVDINLVLSLHDSMRKNEHGDSLPYKHLALFLDLRHDRVGANRYPSLITKVVREVLEIIAIMDRHTPAGRRALSGDDNTAESMVGVMSTARAAL
jgi:hypothetical protein